MFNTERRVDLVVDGMNDALSVGEVVHEAMVGRRLFNYRHVLVVSPRLLARFGDLRTARRHAPHCHAAPASRER